MKHGYEFILKLFKHKPISPKTDLNAALRFALNVLKRKSVVILISDFLDTEYEYNLKALAQKHDLVVVHLYDQREVRLPSLGTIPVMDRESGQIVWVNTSSIFVKRDIRDAIQHNQEQLEKICKQNNANYISIDSQEDYVPQLIQLFRIRN